MHNDNLKKAGHAFLVKSLTPLIRLMLHLNIPLRELIEIAKAVYVEVAERDKKASGRTPSDAKIAALTGVHAKDVRRIRADRPQWLAPEPSDLQRLTLSWTANKEFLDAAGKPAALTIEPDASASLPSPPTFTRLVREVLGVDANVSDVRDQLVRSGIVRTLADGRIEMDVRRLHLNPQFEDRLAVAAFVVRDMSAAVVENLISETRLHTVLMTYSSATTKHAADTMHHVLDEEAFALTARWNERLMKSQSELRAGDQPHRVTCIVAGYSEALGG